MHPGANTFGTFKSFFPKPSLAQAIETMDGVGVSVRSHLIVS